MKIVSPVWLRCIVTASLASAAAAGAATPACAGAWTLPQGQGQVIETLFGWQGWTQPSNARDDKIESQTYVQYGLTDRLTLIGALSFERYALSRPKDVYGGLDTTGAGLRAQLWSGEAGVFSFEATGFYGGASDASRPAQAGGAGPAADVRALFGRNFTLFDFPAFVDAEAGYRLRTQGPPSEWRADLTLGINVTKRVQVLLQAFNTISNGAGTSEFPAWEAHKGELSLVYALDDKWSVQVGGFATLWRRNATSEYGALVAVWRSF